MALSPAPSLAVFNQCLEQASVLSREMMVQLVQQAVAVMQAKQASITSMQARIQWDDDTRDLLRQREQLADHFCKALKQAIDEAARPDAPSAATVPMHTSSAPVRFDQLELVDDAKVQSQIDAGRMQQSAEAACDRELAELDSLVCAARGLKVVKADHNPLRPRAFGNAITLALAQCQSTPAQRDVWVLQLGAVLGPELRKLYVKLIELLRGEQVQAVGYGASYSLAQEDAYDAGHSGVASNVAPATSAYTPPTRAAAPTRSARPAMPKRERAAQAPQLSVNQLRQVLGGANFGVSGQQDQALAEDVMRDLDELDALVQSLGLPSRAHRTAGAERVAGVAPSKLRKAQRTARPTGTHIEQGEDSSMHTSKADAISVHESLDEDEPDYEAQTDSVQDEYAQQGASQYSEQEAQDLAPDPAQQAAIAQDVVRLMVDELCGDQRLLECVRDWVGSMEPALLGLAKVDASFLSDASHPARRMVDEVTGRSLGFSSEQAEGFAAFFDPVVATTVQLEPHSIQDAQPFAVALQAIEHAWAQQKTAAQIQSEQAQQALVSAEQRNLLADKIALELTRRDDARFAPIFVKQFLASVWAHVLAKARLDPDGAAAAQRYLDAVAPLLWSAVPDIIANDKQTLVRMLPGMLSTLRAGLESIGSSAQQEENFFNQLMDIHQAVLKAAAAKPRAAEPAAVSTPAPIASVQPQATPVPVTSAPEIAQAGVWLAPDDMQDAGFIDSEFDVIDEDVPSVHSGLNDIDPAELATDMIVVQAAPEPVSTASDTITQPPDIGTWIEFLSNDQWVRAQLTWASPHGTLYMFTGAAGNPHSMTRRALDKMMARQAIRLARGSGSMMLGALNAVAQAALRNQQAL
jgi:hypothetical protein